jgi:nucleoid-associated protein YgaU
MTAVLSPPHLFPPAGSFRRPGQTRRPARPSRASRAGDRPALTLVTHVEAPPSAARYRLRRTVALLVLCALAVPLQATTAVVATRVLSAAPTAVSGTDHATTSAPPTGAVAAPAMRTVADHTYVVRSGDTLWSIARHLQPEGDVRPLVDVLAERAGGAALQPGQRLDLHGLGT